MVFDKFGLELNRKHFWYDVKNKFFYIPNSDIKIKISAQEALVVIGSYTTFLWDAKKIAQRFMWDSNVNEQLISYFLDEYSKGHLEKVIAWICDNNIECQNKDKFEYLARYNSK